jgi:hypothetical protein
MAEVRYRDLVSVLSLRTRRRCDDKSVDEMERSRTYERDRPNTGQTHYFFDEGSSVHSKTCFWYINKYIKKRENLHPFNFYKNIRSSKF